MYVNLYKVLNLPFWARLLEFRLRQMTINSDKRRMMPTNASGTTTTVLTGMLWATVPVEASANTPSKKINKKKTKTFQKKVTLKFQN